MYVRTYVRTHIKRGKSKRASAGRLLGPLAGAQIVQKANLNFHNPANGSKKKTIDERLVFEKLQQNGLRKQIPCNIDN
jgi:hypothetical protein